MPLITLNQFKGGYKAVLSQSTLGDGETAEARNVEYNLDFGLDKRNGSRRLYNSALGYSAAITSGTAGLTGRPITGHYFFTKLGTSSNYHLIGAGDSIFSYNSSTAVAIRTGLDSGSETFWRSIQIQDPRAGQAAEDIVLMTNGVNQIQAWNGTGTAIQLSSFTSAACATMVCSILLNHKERVYAININDSADADATVLVKRTGFGTDGNADPHRFTESFYVGGSSRDGEILAAGILSDQIIFYKERSIWKFNAGSGDVLDLIQVQDVIGILAPHSMVRVGDYHIFLSNRGVYAFDGNQLQHLSKDVDEDIFKNSSLDSLRLAKAVFNSEANQYTLYYAPSGSTRNSRALVFDMNLKIWQPPITGREVSFISEYLTEGVQSVIYGDYYGYLYRDKIGNSDGIPVGVNSIPTAGSISSVSDTLQNFRTTQDGLSGIPITIVNGPGAGQTRRVKSNTGTVITVDPDWVVAPTTASTYVVGGIDAFWRSKDYDVENVQVSKIFRWLYVKAKEVGSYGVTVYHMCDFTRLVQAVSTNLQMFENGLVWDVGLWDRDYWGNLPIMKKKISLRSNDVMSTDANYIAVAFENNRAEQPFRISGFDIDYRPVGMR